MGVLVSLRAVMEHFRLIDTEFVLGDKRLLVVARDADVKESYCKEHTVTRQICLPAMASEPSGAVCLVDGTWGS